MFSDKLSFLQKAKFKIAQSVAPIKQTSVATFEQVDFALSYPKLKSVLGIAYGRVSISSNFTMVDSVCKIYNVKVAAQAIIAEKKYTDLLHSILIGGDKLELIESPEIIECFDSAIPFPEVIDITNLDWLFAEIENIEFRFAHTIVKGKSYLKKEVSKQITLFSIEELGIEEKQRTGPRIERYYTETNRNEPFDLFDIVFPALQPPLGKHFNNAISFNGKVLYPFQVDGVKFLHNSVAALLGDEMGLGKSIQTITAARFLFREGKITNACIICPKAVLTDWERKIWEWAPELKVSKISGDKTQRELQWQMPAHIYICTYETLLKEVFDKIRTSSDVQIKPKGHSVVCPNEDCGGRILIPYSVFFEEGECPHCDSIINYPRSEDVQATKFDLLILDEVQKTKNPNSKTTKAVRSVKCNYRWGLSGTPLENKVEDLITICETIKPDIFENVNPYIDVQLIEAFKPIFLRRRKEDALQDLPPKVTKEVWLDLLPSQRNKYDLAEKEGIIELEGKGEQLTIQHVLALITKLKQICNYDVVERESAKLDYLLEEMEKVREQGDKALVFSQYPNETLRRILPHLELYNPSVYDGSLSDLNRTKIITDFQETENSQLLLLSLRAGNAGITLTRANYVYHFDLWWNPAVSAQAVDRAHRIGQKKVVFERILLAEDTIERRIFNILAEKKRLFNEIVDGLSDTDFISNSLTEAEIFGLFGLKKSQALPDTSTNLDSSDFEKLDPFEFEHFVGELFAKMGYYSKVTKKSGDGGVDIIAKIQTPTGIDEIIIQCKHKQDSNSAVGVDKVRELFGVLSANRHLAKAILVTNGKFTSGCFEFAKGKLIELVDGARLKGYTELYK